MSKLKIIDIENKYNAFKFSPIDLFLIDKINNNIELIISKTISELAIEWNVSLPSLSRLSKKLGFENLNHLRLFIVAKSSEMKKYLISENKDISKIAQNINNFASYSLKHTLTNNDNVGIIEEISKKIIGSNKIFIFGIDDNFYAVETLGNNLNSIGMTSIFTNNNNTFTTNMLTMKKNDIVLIISNKFSVPYYKNIAIYLKKNKIETYLITSAKQKFNDFKRVLIMNNEIVNILNKTSIKIVQIAIVETIFYNVLLKTNNQNKLSIADSFPIL